MSIDATRQCEAWYAQRIPGPSVRSFLTAGLRATLVSK
jgi:hypothetical protein